MPRGRFSYYSVLHGPITLPCTVLHARITLTDPFFTASPLPYFIILSRPFPLSPLSATARPASVHRKERKSFYLHYSMYFRTSKSAIGLCIALFDAPLPIPPRHRDRFSPLLHITTGMDFPLCPTSPPRRITQRVSSKQPHLSAVYGLSS
jgi:hypothetical protein